MRTFRVEFAGVGIKLEGNDSESGMNFESEGGLQRKSDDSAIHEVEMADFRMKPCLFAVIRCILYVRLLASFFVSWCSVSNPSCKRLDRFL